jgi:hypothetical protein
VGPPGASGASARSLRTQWGTWLEEHVFDAARDGQENDHSTNKRTTPHSFRSAASKYDWSDNFFFLTPGALGAAAAFGLSALPVPSLVLRTVISTRRFFALPSAVELSAIGLSWP